MGDSHPRRVYERTSTTNCLWLRRTESLTGGGQINYECGKRWEATFPENGVLCNRILSLYFRLYYREENEELSNTSLPLWGEKMPQVIISQTLPFEPPPFLPHVKQLTGRNANGASPGQALPGHPLWQKLWMRRYAWDFVEWKRVCAAEVTTHLPPAPATPFIEVWRPVSAPCHSSNAYSLTTRGKCQVLSRGGKVSQLCIQM